MRSKNKCEVIGMAKHNSCAGTNRSSGVKVIKPRKCDATPGTKGCAKTRGNGGMLCKNCTAWKHVG